MPLVNISLSTLKNGTKKQAIADGIHRALVSALGIPLGDRFQKITELNDEHIVADANYLGIARESVVYVEITLVQGRSLEQKQHLYRKIVENLSDLGVRPEDVFIVLTENAKENWSVGNGVASLVEIARSPSHPIDVLRAR